MTEEALNQKSKSLQIHKCITEIRKIRTGIITHKRIRRISNKYKLSITHIKNVGGWNHKSPYLKHF